MTKKNTEPTDLTNQYLTLLNSIRENTTTLTPSDIEQLLIDSNYLLDQIQRPSTLKLDAIFLSQSAKFSNNYFSKQVRNSNLNIPLFIQMIKNNDDRYFHECRKRYGFGIKFSKKINLQCEEKKTLNKSVNKSLTDSKPDVPQNVEEKEEKECISDKIQKIVHKHGKIEFYRLVIDPNSYSKTIENIFYCSFAIRRNKVGLLCENEKIYVCKDKKEVIENEHLIFEINCQEYRKIVDKLGLKECIL